jgi:endonuclease/exonuclease/phosphatase family metal-dependent hydrolase
LIRVLTLNIWNLMGPWRQRRTEIVAWIDRLEPDVVCLQEVIHNADGRNQAGWIAAAAEGDWEVAPGPAWTFADGGWFGNAVLSRKSIDATSVTLLPFERRPDDEQRGLLHARTGGIDVFCTHLNWRYEDGLIRERQVAAIVEAIASLADPASPLPPILAGDMNAEPDSTEMRYVSGLTSLGEHSTYFQDAWRVAGGRGPGWTWDNRNPYANAVHEPDRRIDYVFVGWRRASGAGRVESARVVCDRALTGTFASDHFGLLAEINEG